MFFAFLLALLPVVFARERELTRNDYTAWVPNSPFTFAEWFAPFAAEDAEPESYDKLRVSVNVRSCPLRRAAAVSPCRCAERRARVAPGEAGSARARRPPDLRANRRRSGPTRRAAGPLCCSFLLLTRPCPRCALPFPLPRSRFHHALQAEPSRMVCLKRHVKIGDSILFHYEALLTDGSIVDTTEGGEPLEVIVGAGMVIEGLDTALEHMCKGELRTIRVPAEKAYGASGAPPLIPPNASLLFHVIMVDWTD